MLQVLQHMSRCYTELPLVACHMYANCLIWWQCAGVTLIITKSAMMKQAWTVDIARKCMASATSVKYVCSLCMCMSRQFQADA
jgi:hypothetical protein